MGGQHPHGLLQPRAGLWLVGRGPGLSHQGGVTLGGQWGHARAGLSLGFHALQKLSEREERFLDKGEVHSEHEPKRHLWGWWLFPGSPAALLQLCGNGAAPAPSPVQDPTQPLHWGNRLCRFQPVGERSKEPSCPQPCTGMGEQCGGEPEITGPASQQLLSWTQG